MFSPPKHPSQLQESRVLVALKNFYWGNSLVAQWLGLHAFTAEDREFSPWWGFKILGKVCAKKKKKKVKELLYNLLIFWN